MGSAIIQELLDAGHQVLGLARSDAAAATVSGAGAEVHRGSLEDLESLRRGAGAADGVIHTGFFHDFSRFPEACEIDRLAILAMGKALAGSGRPLIVTSGVGFSTTGRLRTEADPPTPRTESYPRASEEAGAAVEAQGVHVSVVSLPQVHDPYKQGFVTFMIANAREKGVSAYVGDGLNRWAAVHRNDAARLYRMVLEKGESGIRYNAVAEEGVPAREIADAIGRGLKVPVVSLSPDQADEHFGWLGMFAGLDLVASSALTKERLGWRPTGPGLIADLDEGRCFGT
jgi:nucleoside-diphosphate-sugar epimerase